MSVIIRKKCERTGREFPVTMSEDEARKHLTGDEANPIILSVLFDDPKVNQPPITIDYKSLSPQSLRLVRRCVAELAPKLPKPKKERKTRSKPATPVAPAAPSPTSETSAEAATTSASNPA